MGMERHERALHMYVCAVCNQKGGVGKTTTVFNVADAAAKAGARVLAIDLDPQGNLTTILAKEDAVQTDSVGIADALAASTDETIADVIVDTIWPNVALAPTVPENDVLSAVRDQLVVAGAGRERRLKSQLDTIRDQYDLVLIDCPPSLDQLTINALTAAHRAVIVTEAALFSVNGLAKLRRNIALVAESYNPVLDHNGTVVNKLEAETIGGREQLAEIREAVGVIGTPLPKAVVIKDASEASVSLMDWGTSKAKNLHAFYRDIYRDIAAGAGEELAAS